MRFSNQPGYEKYFKHDINTGSHSNLSTVNTW